MRFENMYCGAMPLSRSADITLKLFSWISPSQEETFLTSYPYPERSVATKKCCLCMP